jgi:hypothetical protein
LPLKAIAYRRIGHDRQIDIAAKVFLPFRVRAWEPNNIASLIAG